MRIVVTAVGRARDRALKELFEEYARRLVKTGRHGWSLSLAEIAERDTGPAEARKRREAELLRKAIPHGARVIVLDQRGKALSSEAFAARLAHHQADGVRDLAFVIGGADGVDADLLREADEAMSLGSMTWPHLLVRVMLAEQIYRAQSILLGHPYHRG